MNVQQYVIDLDVLLCIARVLFPDIPVDANALYIKEREDGREVNLFVEHQSFPEVKRESYAPIVRYAGNLSELGRLMAELPPSMKPMYSVVQAFQQASKDGLISIRKS